MTHDIKNLLQSLNVLCSVAATEERRDSPELHALLRRQLPAMSQRLSETLARLQQPGDADETYVAARVWWDALARQYRGEGVQFAPGEIPDGLRLPRSLFDSVADNLIRNALAKRVPVHVALEWSGHIEFSVCDAGPAIPSEVAAQLLRGPVSSRGGLGIGLYQAARQAEELGYRLRLETNRDGAVCFVLEGRA